MTRPEVVHDRFTIERDYPVPPAEVFAAFSEPAAKRRWFAETEGWRLDAYELDFRVGGHERAAGAPPEGAPYRFDSTYLDIVPDVRMIYAYTMHIDGTRISASLTTIALNAVDRGTRLTLTEQGAFLDGHDRPDDRKGGTAALLDALGNELAGARRDTRGA